ncbi:MAG: molybdenum cofactor biosynthesis protein MoaE [Flavobacteriaceae bacterium]
MESIVELVDDIDVGRAYQAVSHPKSGGVCVFVGTVREFTNSEEVVALEFESYQKMALSEMRKIAEEAAAKWSLNSVLLHHALGNKKVGEPVVVVGASAAHRPEAFEACRYLIDTLKKNVPIWKKEIFKNKQVWVSSNP